MFFIGSHQLFLLLYTDNNQARSETPEQAIDMDQRTRKSWLGHAHM
jgi:hypothetical protein